MLARFYAMLFCGNIAYLVTALTVIVDQLKTRAVDKQTSAAGREEAARVLLAEAEAERLEAKVAINMADKLTKLLK